MNELHSPSENELAMCDRLLGDDCFRDSAWVMSLRACALYHLHGQSIAYELALHAIVIKKKKTLDRQKNNLKKFWRLLHIVSMTLTSTPTYSMLPTIG